MVRNTTKLTVIGLVALLVVALALPTVAFAGSGSTAGYTGGQTAGTGAVGTGAAGTGAAGSDVLRSRVVEALQRRAQRFEQAAQTMEQRRERIMELAGVVEQAGGDVEPVRTRLAECERLLVQAREQEQVAAQMFRSVPDAGDRRGAFMQARIQARTAVQTMNQARVQLREAAQVLKDIADDLDEDDDA
ncbi:MAG: hypothetical protein Q7W51_10595 [Coriobacteriia bacterium]|nr:hypothetical protein [Coriobacteriia bacterium]